MDRREALYGLIGLAGWRRLLRGAEPPQRLDLGGASLEVYISSDNFVSGNSALIDWVRRSARAVMAYFGRFPVDRSRLYITVTDRGRVSHGVTYGEDGAHITISVGRNATIDDLYKDWELTHEMVHLGFPSVNRSHHWIEEGIATYVEPIARASIGILSAEEVWGEMRRDMPQGLPQAGDQGLDHTHTWDRTYWGGAPFGSAVLPSTVRLSYGSISRGKAPVVPCDYPHRAIPRVSRVPEERYLLKSSFAQPGSRD